MNKWKQVDIYTLNCKKDFEVAISTINKIICNLDDLEDYYHTISFKEDLDKTKKDKEWWQYKLKEIKEDFIDFQRNTGDDENV